MPSAVIVPASPALVPVVSGRAPELDDVRTAARAAARELLAGPVDRVVVVADASGEADETWSPDLAGYGVPDAPRTSRPLPAGYTTAAWLLDDAGWNGRRAYQRPATAETTDGDVVVVVADGSACRSERAPGHLDPRAEGVDARLSAALAAGDLGVLDELDEALADELMIGGLSALRWLRAATAGHDVTAHVTYTGAPLGVGLWVARWAWSPPAG